MRFRRLPISGLLPEKAEYRVDIRGFLLGPDSWGPLSSMHRALEMKIPQRELTDAHWRVIDLRDVCKREDVCPSSTKPARNIISNRKNRKRYSQAVIIARH
jgi:sulfur relay (sulfurtransferase) DsrC/TusE family protein